MCSFFIARINPKLERKMQLWFNEAILESISSSVFFLSCREMFMVEGKLMQVANTKLLLAGDKKYSEESQCILAALSNSTLPGDISCTTRNPTDTPRKILRKILIVLFIGTHSPFVQRTKNGG